MPVKGRVVIKGVPETQDILRKVSPVLAGEMNKEFKRLGRDIATGARAITPVRSGKSKRSIRVYLGAGKIKRSSSRAAASDRARRAGGTAVPPGGNRSTERLSGFRVVQNAKGGSILEFADKWRNDRGRKMVEAVRRKYPQRPGRFMWLAHDRRRGQVDASLQKIRRDTEAKLQAMASRS